MEPQDEVYDPRRAERLVELLRSIAARIAALDQAGRLLDSAAELQRLFGEARSELFHYEVRCTYDTPEVAESRRLVEEASGQSFLDEPEDDEPWRRRAEED